MPNKARNEDKIRRPEETESNKQDQESSGGKQSKDEFKYWTY